VRYLWDGDELCAEIDSERGMRVFAGIPGTFLPLLQVEPSGVYFAVPNHIGTPGELVDAKGHVAWAASLSPWGELVETRRDPAHAGSTVASPFRLLGQYHDEETGLCYARYRWFDAATMRWLTPDPLEVEGGSDAFGFNGSPTEHTDPLGLKSRTEVEDLFVRTDKAREDAHAAAQAEQAQIRADVEGDPNVSPERRPFVEAQCTSAAKEPFDPNAPAPQVGRNDPGGTGAHAETNIGPLDGTAVGAGRPHCANCVAAIQAGGGVTASPIRSSGDTGVWDPPPATPPGSTPVQDPSW
jgi:RHS repeat-associated protein